MTYERFSDGMGLLSSRNISINFVLPFILNSEVRLWGCRLNKDNPGSRRSIRKRSYILETSLVGWTLRDR
jgi:hypothetical protein